MKIWVSAAAFTCLILSAAFAQEPPATAPVAAAQSNFALTIYSTVDPATFDPQDAVKQAAQDPTGAQQIPGYGVVREIRGIDLNPGENTLKFTDVAAGIDPTTVAFKSLTAPESTSVLEQNFEFDLVNPDKLLQKYVGKQIILNRKQVPLTDEKTRQPETIEAKLLSYDGNTYVLQTDNRRLPVELVPRSADITEIKLFDLETGLITKPTLVWKLQADKGGRHDAQVTYQTDGLTWRADYNLVVSKDDTATDLSAWVSILNLSGASYPNSKLKLVAGDVQRLERPDRNGGGGGLFGGGTPKPDTGFAEKAFFEYHLYTLGRTTSLPNNSTKQVELFPARTAIPLTKVYVYYGVAPAWRHWDGSDHRSDRDLGILMNKKVDLYLQINNTEKGHLGIPLPAGRVRVYKKDEADGASEFVGEDIIQHTPKDEQFSVRLGSVFDIVGERRQTSFTTSEDQRSATESFEITLRNHKKEPVTVIVKENLYRWVNWEITASSDKHESADARTIHFPVTVPPDGEKKVTYTVKYSW